MKGVEGRTGFLWLSVFGKKGLTPFLRDIQGAITENRKPKTHNPTQAPGPLSQRLFATALFYRREMSPRFHPPGGNRPLGRKNGQKYFHHP